MLKIRLRRMGARNAPFYRVVVSDQRRVPGSTALEEIGYYDPKQKPAAIQLDEERIDYWVGNGAQLSETVRRLRGKSNVERPAAPAPAAQDAGGDEAAAEA
ncbi:MAG: 30S ribosomal protein S16 [Acidobacteria bacterium]|nr:MAG: 30S ribosomal protein S16 [Acidobacteriota bacterium]REK11620.1 MAG: 30S ribosomal protein S16 [Acidobacteriota bacterium]